MDIASRIRKLRRRQGRTLEEVAGRCGFTKSLLSKIENARTVPPVATLTRIAAALGVGTSALLDGEGLSGTVRASAAQIEAQEAVRTESGYRFRALAAGRPDKLMQPFIFEVEEGKVRRHSLSHAGEEFLYVLEGRLRYRVGRTEHLLDPGDSLYFDAEEEHEVTPASARARYLAVFVERPAEDARRAPALGTGGKAPRSSRARKSAR
jgi:transcriptional regulator with XRE-family HTH domain